MKYSNMDRKEKWKEKSASISQMFQAIFYTLTSLNKKGAGEICNPRMVSENKYNS